MKIMFALAVIFGLVVTEIDIKGAFLYPELKRPVYIISLWKMFVPIILVEVKTPVDIL